MVREKNDPPPFEGESSVRIFRLQKYEEYSNLTLSSRRNFHCFNIFKKGHFYPC